MKNILIFIALILSCYSHSFAKEKTTLEERIPNAIKKKDASFLTLTVENDLFASGADENYTSGCTFNLF